jgi:hypothetical protein
MATAGMGLDLLFFTVIPISKNNTDKQKCKTTFEKLVK